jgi:hypothetical protein
MGSIVGGTCAGAFRVIPANVWDSLYGGTDSLDVAVPGMALDSTVAKDATVAKATALATTDGVVDAIKTVVDTIAEGVSPSGVLTVSGKITDDDGVGIMDAEVWLTADSDPSAVTGTDTGVLVQHAFTEDNGDYLFHVDDPHYWLHARKDGAFNENSVRVAAV